MNIIVAIVIFVLCCIALKLSEKTGNGWQIVDKEDKHLQATFSIVDEQKIIVEDYNDIENVYRRLVELISQFGTIVLVTVVVPGLLCYVTGAIGR